MRRMLWRGVLGRKVAAGLVNREPTIIQLGVLEILREIQRGQQDMDRLMSRLERGE